MKFFIHLFYFMTENYEKLSVSSDTLEPFVLCLALGTLKAMKSNIWSSEAGIWTIGRPIFLSKLEKLKISEDTLNILVEFDEFDALEKLVTKEDFYNKLLEVEENIKKRLKDFSENFWYAHWA